MRTKYKIVLTAIILTGFSLFTACEKGFDKINEDPNAITEVPSDYLLPGAVFSIASYENSFMENLSYSSAWVQQISCAYWPSNGNYSYEKARGLLWDNMYVGPLKDLKTMSEIAGDEGNQTQKAVAMILSSYSYALLTDSYGPIPFFEALNAEGNVNKPEFDSQEEIYMALIDSLKLASQLLKNQEKIVITSGYDNLCNGDAEKWYKFANALQLKFMMRISMKNDMSLAISELVNDPEILLLQSISDNIKYTFPATAPKNYNPFYSTLSSEATDGGYRLCNTLVDYMNSINDPRLPFYGLLNEDGEYNGLPSGQGISANEMGIYSKVNTYWGKKDRPAFFISYSEVLFLLAEACQRGILTENASNYYYLAIKAHFEDLGLSNAQYNSFITEPGVIYNNSLKIIMDQKWISLFTRGIEAWAEQKRTGYPALIPVPGGAVNVIPYRFQYPISEGQSNNENLMEAILSLSNGDALDSKIWWINR